MNASVPPAGTDGKMLGRHARFHAVRFGRRPPSTLPLPRGQTVFRDYMQYFSQPKYRFVCKLRIVQATKAAHPKITK